jgi:hypothetical protein
MIHVGPWCCRLGHPLKNGLVLAVFLYDLTDGGVGLAAAQDTVAISGRRGPCAAWQEFASWGRTVSRA